MEKYSTFVIDCIRERHEEKPYNSRITEQYNSILFGKSKSLVIIGNAEPPVNPENIVSKADYLKPDNENEILE